MNIINILKQIINNGLKKKLYEKIYILSFFLVYLLFILSFFTSYKYYNYITLIRTGLKYFVIVFLIIKFNPFTKLHCNNFDKMVIFQSAIFLLLSTMSLNITPINI